ncbi:Cdc6/Cdc18 family protein [Methanococcoides seepicolus]|uniref:ORC1-type DNA replication protein n=1 Tax=Methanococcoides seepicolus TaxID=2828780 RepID=A0A9E5DBE5_9EURY|nr:AAA family ATPase [Methanococcoides seepicolus]MCM1986293.1 AAA family ATPase [Methanococcoides seepicolus]
MNIFENISNSIFRDIRCLENDYIPSKLIGRDYEIGEIADACKPIFINGKPRNLFLFGKPGTGKSVTSAYVINQLKESIKKQKLDIEVVHFRVSCKDKPTSTAVLRELIKQAKPGTRLPGRGLGFDDYLEYFSDIFSNDSHRLIIVVLDEIDCLKDDKILYILSRADEMCLLPKNTKFSIIGISNNFDSKKSIGTNVVSSLYMKDILFNPYKEEQLFSILNDRLDAFCDDVVDEEVISLCSRLSAEKHGNARETIQLLKEVGHLAENNGDSKVKLNDVHIVTETANVAYLGDVIMNLPELEKRVFLAVVQLSNHTRCKTQIKTDTVVSKQDELSRKFKMKPLSRQDVSQMLNGLALSQLISIQKGNDGRKNTSIIKLDEEVKKQSLVIENVLEKSIYESHI